MQFVGFIFVMLLTFTQFVKMLPLNLRQFIKLCNLDYVTQTLQTFRSNLSK